MEQVKQFLSQPRLDRGWRDFGGKHLFRNRLLAAFFALLLLFCTMPMEAFARETAYTDARYSNGRYVSSLSDMAGRRLYVYGVVDSEAELDEGCSDQGIRLNAEAPAGRLDTALWLYRLCGTAPESPCPFADVPEKYADAVSWLYEAGVTKGVGGGNYGTGNITRYQFLVMLSRFFQWDAEDVDTLRVLALDQGLLPETSESGSFSRGELFQILCALLDQHFPERRIAARPEIGPPHILELTVASYADAQKQIGKALCFLPRYIMLSFAEDCLQEEIDTFLSSFDWVNDGIAKVIFDGSSHGFLSPYFMCMKQDQRFRLWIPDYAPAYMASADSLDWLRIYQDTSFSDALQQFAEEYLDPLLVQSSDYVRAKKAHDLLRRLASYDYDEYYRHTRFEAHSLLGFMQHRQVVCDGYAKTYQWMLRYLGIDSYVVVGTAAGDSHAWNKVLLDGQWYNVDVCWDDGGYGSFFFLKSDASFEANQHQFTDSFSTTSYASAKDYGW